MPTGGGTAIVDDVLVLGPEALLELKMSCNVGGGAAACIVDNILEVAPREVDEYE